MEDIRCPQCKAGEIQSPSLCPICRGTGWVNKTELKEKLNKIKYGLNGY